MKQKLAVIWSWISWIACAHYLKDEYDVSIFEKNDYVWGHTHTHKLEENNTSFTLDTWFIVFNNETYPHLLKLFAELWVEKKDSDMWFSVWNKSINLQYCGSGISYLFAQKRNLFSLKFWKFLFEIQRFFKHANKDYPTIQESTESIREYCENRNLSLYFIDNYLVPMSAAVWSSSHENMYDFPIALLLPFFHNHGLLWMNKQFQRYTVRWWSNMYTKKILEQWIFSLHVQEPVIQVEENSEWVSVHTAKSTYTFDKVIVATHANTSMKLVTSLTQEKKALLAWFDYNKNIAVLHTDASIMPPKHKAWAAWTHIINQESPWHHQASTVYWMNKLQKPKVKQNYFVSINPFYEIDKKKILKEIQYEHPLFTRENFASQSSLHVLNEDSNILFCGSYFGAGFHEDGLRSAIDVVNILRSNPISA